MAAPLHPPSVRWPTAGHPPSFPLRGADGPGNATGPHRTHPGCWTGRAMADVNGERLLFRYLRAMAGAERQGHDCSHAIQGASSARRPRMAGGRRHARRRALLWLAEPPCHALTLLGRGAGIRITAGERGRSVVPGLRGLVLGSRGCARVRRQPRADGRPGPPDGEDQRRSPNSPRRSLGSGLTDPVGAFGSGPSTTLASSRSPSAACDRGAPRTTGLPSLTALR